MTPMNDTFWQTEASNPPTVVKWFKVYCGIACLFYLCFVPLSWAFFLASTEEMTAADADIMGLFLLAASLLSLALCSCCRFAWNGVRGYGSMASCLFVWV